MKTNTIKSFTKNWQEILFIGSIGLLLFEILKFSLTQNSMDPSDIALLSFMLPIFIALIGQLYWNNKTLSRILSVILSIGSFSVILMALYYVATTSSNLIQAISMLFFGIFLLFASITMARKRKLTSH